MITGRNIGSVLSLNRASLHSRVRAETINLGDYLPSLISSL
jgi:hypothetical protein